MNKEGEKRRETKVTEGMKKDRGKGRKNLGQTD